MGDEPRILPLSGAAVGRVLTVTTRWRAQLIENGWTPEGAEALVTSLLPYTV